MAETFSQAAIVDVCVPAETTTELSDLLHSARNDQSENGNSLLGIRQRELLFFGMSYEYTNRDEVLTHSQIR